MSIRGSNSLAPAVLLLPFFAMFAIFYAVPLAGGVLTSLESGQSGEGIVELGLGHYRAVLGDPRYGKAVANTGIYLVACLLATLPVSIVLAHLLAASWRRLRPLLAFGLLAPGLTPPAVLAILFVMVFYGRTGMLNHYLLEPFNVAPIPWLKHPDWILPALVIQCGWRWTGIVTFFLLAALDAVPQSQREAARLEGAGSIARARYVSIPFLRPVILFCGVYLAVDALALFAGSWLLLGGSGGTADAGLLLISYVHQQGRVFGNPGQAAAAALLIAPVLLGLLALLVMRFGGRRA